MKGFCFAKKYWRNKKDGAAFATPSALRRVLAAAILAAAVAVGGKKGRKRSVLIKAIQKRYDDGQATAAQNVRAENAVLAAEYKQRDQDPKSRVTLREAIHKKPPVLDRRGYVLSKTACGFVFLIHIIRFFKKRCWFF